MAYFSNYKIKPQLNETQFLSEIELAILRSEAPIEIDETETVTVNQQTGILVNKNEINSWKGDLKLSDYSINEDSSPHIITKKIPENLEYVQVLAIRYLRPLTPPKPDDIIISMEPDIVAKPAPPIIICQTPKRPKTPDPLIIRESPPARPKKIPVKVITISGKRLPPPPRKVVIERFANLPAKPQTVIIERWLPYKEPKRRVILNKTNAPEPIVTKPRNVVIQWEPPEVRINCRVKHMGVVQANPAQYVQEYGRTLTASSALPKFVQDIPSNVGVLAKDAEVNQIFELEGDLEAFKYVDLEKEGLLEYRAQLNQMGIDYIGSKSKNVTYKNQSLTKKRQQTLKLIEKIFAQLDESGEGFIELSEAESIYTRIYTRLARRYNDDDVNNFFRKLDTNLDGLINIQKFHLAFKNTI